MHLHGNLLENLKVKLLKESEVDSKLRQKLKKKGLCANFTNLMGAMQPLSIITPFIRYNLYTYK